MSNQLLSVLKSHADQMGDDEAILAPDRPSLNYAALWLLACEIGASLRAANLSASSRVAIVLPNGAEAATAFLGVAAHAVCAPLNPAYQVDEFRFYLTDARAEAIIVAHSDSGPARQVARELGLVILEANWTPDMAAGTMHLSLTQDTLSSTALERMGSNAGDHSINHSGQIPADYPARTALILHTSGTTAKPKIVPLSEDNLYASAQAIAGHLCLSPADRCLNLMPLFHIHGLIGTLLSSVIAGASIVCTPGPNYSALFDWIAKTKPSWYSAVPTIHQTIIANSNAYRQKAPDHQFRFIRSSSASLPTVLLDQLEQLFDAPVIEAYGMTEATHQMSSNPLPPAQRKSGSVGVSAGAEVAIMTEAGELLPCGQIGEVVIRGAGVTSGYEANTNANQTSFTDGWFRTGDQGRLDQDGYLFLTGRLKEIVNRGGEKVAPREIDDALLEHPGVTQAVAFAVPHPSLGEDLAAAVVGQPNDSLNEAELRFWLFDRLAPHKVPSQVLIVDAIPKGATGKIQRIGLHQHFTEQLTGTQSEPRTVTESTLAKIFAEILQVKSVSADANFFTQGGDSLSGARVLAWIESEFGSGLPLTDLFRFPTVRALAERVDNELQTASSNASNSNLEARINALSDEQVEQLLANDLDDTELLQALEKIEKQNNR